MSRGLESEVKSELVARYRVHDSDTGSTEVQCKILSVRIDGLTAHVNVHKKDHHTRLGLLKLVAQRRRLLGYLRRTDFDRYKALSERLNAEGHRV